MIRSIRFLVSVAAVVSTLAFAGTATGAYNPLLLVAGGTHTLGGAGPVIVGIAQSENDDATATVKVYSPTGYGVTLGQPPGTQLGTVSGVVKIGALGGSRQDVTGTLKTDNPANYVTNQCAPGLHEAVWVLEFTLLGTPYRAPLYVDRVTTGPEAAYASARIQVCLASPYVDPPQGAPSRASLVIAVFTVRSVFTTPKTRGSYPWNASFVPFVPGTATPNPANSAQSTSFVRLPARLALKARRQKRGKRTFALVTACVTEAGQAVRGARVILYGGRTIRRAKRVGAGRTNARGCLKTSVRVRTRAMLLFAAANIDDRQAPRCQPTIEQRCSNPSIAPVIGLFSNAERVRR